MTEPDLLDMFIQERINVLLNNLSKTRPKKTNAFYKQSRSLIISLKKNENLCKTTLTISQIYLHPMNHICINKDFLMASG